MTDGARTLPHTPYIGARPFRRNETIYGRAREARDLLSLLVGNRIVLLNSPSGAGKTSLIQASLIPRLEKRRFVVRPTIRVGAPAPVAGANRYLLSVMQSLEEGRPAAEQLPAEQLAGLSLREYLAERSTHGAEHGQVLIFDQFEEVLTLDPTDEPARLAFFEQLGDALADEGLWALFAIREEYVAALEPYGYLVPSRFAISFRLALLGVEAAEEAIRGPAESRGVQFDEGVAEGLANDLAKVIVQVADGRPEERVGTSVEPVQLQVVCYRLWEKRFAESGGGDLSGQRIGMGDVRAIGSIDRALEEYYDSGVARATAAGQVGERLVRSWVDTQLITRQGFRSQVLAGNEGSFGLNEATIDGLTDAYLVREERRRGMAWLELAHDRLIAPVRASNARWFAANLSPLQRQAEVWAAQGQPDSLLFRDADLLAAEQWAAANAAGLTENEQKFLESCREERQRAEERARQARRIRALAWVASGVGIVALALAGVAFNLYGQANTQAAVARTAEANAQAQLRRSDSLRLASAAQDAYRDSAERGLLLALEASARDDNPVTSKALRDGLSDRLLWFATLDGRINWSEIPVFSPDGSRILTANYDGTTRLWDASGQLLTTLEGDSLEFSPDGSRILTASYDNTARLWDASGQPLATLQGHTDEVASAEFSPDGSRILTASYDNTARLWDASGQPLATLQGHTDGVTSAVFSPDGSRILTLSNDSTTRLWDASGQFITTLEDQSGVFSPDGSRILAFSQDNTPRLWDASGRLIATLEGYSAVFSPDGRRILAILDDNTARLWDATGKPLATLRGHTDRVTSVVFSPDGTKILTASQDSTARLWDASGQFLVALEGLDTIREAIFSPDGSKIITASGNTARLWDASGQSLANLDHSNTVLNVTFSRDGKRILTTSRGSTAWLWDEAGEPLSTLTLTELYSAVFTPDGSSILTVSADNTARLWAMTDLPLPTLNDPEAISSAVFSPDGTKILTVLQADIARVWDASGQPLATLTGHTAYVDRAVFSPDGSRILTVSQDYTARVWDTSGQPLAILKGHTDLLFSAVFSPDGSRILTASSDNTARLWDAMGQPLATLEGHTDWVTSAVFSPDGSRILTASSDNTERLWDLSGQIITTLEGGNAVFSPDSSRILTTSDDGTARLWDASGQPLATITGHEGPVYSAVFSPDGSRILTASDDNTARLWDASGQPLATLTGHEGPVVSAVFSPNGTHILTASNDDPDRLWDASGQFITTLERESSVLSPDGSRILTTSNFTARQYLVLTEDLRRAAACRVSRGLTDEEIARFEVPEPLAFDFAERQCPPVYSWQQGR